MNNIKSDVSTGNIASDKKLPGFIEMVRETFTLYRSKQKILIHLQMANFAGSILAGLIIAIAWRSVFFKTIFFDGNADAILKNTVTVVASLFFIAILFFLSLIDGATIIVLRDKESSFSWSQAVRKAAPYVIPCVLAGLIFWVAVLTGTALFFLPGAVVTVWLIPTRYLVVDSNYNWWQALAVSRSYTRGFFWELFILILLGMISSFFVLSLLSNLFILPLGDLLYLVATALVWPIFPVYYYLIFNKLRLLNMRGVEPPRKLNSKITIMAGVIGLGLVISAAGAIVSNGPAVVDYFKSVARETEIRNQNLLRQFPQKPI